MLNKERVQWIAKNMLGKHLTDEEALEVVVALNSMGVVAGVMGLMSAIDIILKKQKEDS